LLNIIKLSYLNQNRFNHIIDKDFTAVLERCKNQKRKGQEGTWLFPKLQQNLIQLHKLGYALSVEVWQNDELVGGLYGISLGKIFYGESMFTSVSNASKFGFIRLAQWLEQRDSLNRLPNKIRLI